MTVHELAMLARDSKSFSIDSPCCPAVSVFDPGQISCLCSLIYLSQYSVDCVLLIDFFIQHTENIQFGEDACTIILSLLIFSCLL